MIKIIKPRYTGKTTDLLRIAAQKDYILVEPNFRMAKNADKLAGELGLKVKIITAHDFIERCIWRMKYRNCRYLIDELEMFLHEIARIEGYSDTDGDRAPRPKKDIVDHAWDNIDHDPFVGSGW